MAVSVIEEIFRVRKILRTIIVDEADRLKVDLVEHLRDVHDLTGAPIVLIGEEGLFAKINAHRRIWSRVVQTVEFGPITPEDIMLFALEAAALRMDPDAAKRVSDRSSGDFRLVWADVHRLEQMAKASGSKRIETRMVDSLNGNGRRRSAGGGDK